MNIYILCSNNIVSDARVFQKEAVSFSNLGHNVTIVARFRSSYSDIEKSKLKKVVRNYGIAIIELPSRSGIFWRLCRCCIIFVKCLFCDADVYYCHELDSLVVGIILKYIHGRKLIYDCHEYYPEKKYYKYSKYLKIIGVVARKVTELVFDRFIYKGADSIVAVNKHMADRLKKRSGKKLFILPNYPSKNFMHQKPVVSKQLPSSTLIYIGGLNRQRNIHGLVRVLAIIRNKYNIDATLAIFGKGSTNYIQYLKMNAYKLGVHDSVILDSVSEIDIPHLLSQAKIGLFLLKADDPSHQWGEPMKFFEYAAAGLPVIFSDLQAKRNLVEIFENGFVVDPDDEEKAAQYCI